ncbi:MAG: sortase [Candidatus Beckwithbacteria bacterium]|nr:sortase [Patescibacteria group bacterium]
MSVVYIKAPIPDPRVTAQNQKRLLFFFNLKKLIPTIMITVGASLLISVGYPIVSYELTLTKDTKRTRFISPVPKESIAESKGILSPTSPNNPQVLAVQTQNQGATVNYSNINSWFNFSKPQIFLSPSRITHYTISIPRLKISNATVTIGGDDLDASLIHYGGTAYPGEAGNSVIFGHSVLPQFYNPNSYRSIFSLIPTLDNGDEIFISYDGISYKYIVYDYYEVAPDEVDILEQRYNQKELTLVTCTPPGTYWRRGIIKARLKEI